MKKALTLIALAMLVITSVMAQNKQISGVVIDEKGEPIIGASIQVKGTSLGTITDFDGAFALSVPEEAKTLVISYIGMATQEVAVKNNLRITLKENTEVIQEVVVTGYGNVSKGSFAGSAQAVTSETIEKKAPSEISKALAGEVAGVQVVNTSGQPGTNASIRIRGIGSINAGSAPLYVVDGVTFDGDISSIDPGDIASTTVLKDATATSLYGSRGANGVIVITTKNGNANEQAKITVDLNYGANMHLLPMYDVITSPQEYVEMAWQSLYNSMSGSTDTKITNANNALFSAKGLPVAYNLWNADGKNLINGYTDGIPGNGKFWDDGSIAMKECYGNNISSWENAMFHVGQKLDAKVSISGGKDKTTYFTSFGYLKDEGYYINSDFQRFSVRTKVEHQAKKWLKGSVNMSYAYTTMNNDGQGSNMNNGFAYVNGIPPIYPVYLYNADGTIATDPKTGDKAYDYGMNEGWGRGFGSGINPAGALRFDRNYTVSHQLSANAMLDFKFYKDLHLEVTAGVMYYGGNTSSLTNMYYGDAAGLGRIAKGQQNYLSFESKQLLKYNKVIGEHTIDVMAGHESHLTTNSVMSGNKSKIADPAGLELGNAIQTTSTTSYTSEVALESWIAQANYWYNERYGLTANYRADGSSKFAKKHRWGHFGSVGFAWKFTNEDFAKPASRYLKDGKLRLSWGMLGNQNIGSDVYHDMYNIKYVDGMLGFVWNYKGNPDITWEKASQVDVGVDFSIGKWVDMELDYFYKLTSNCLLQKYTAPSIGYGGYWINGGKLQNQGFEFQVRAHAVDTRNVKLDIRWNGGFYRNMVKELPKDDINMDTEMDTNGGLVVGHSLYEYKTRTYLGVDPESGQAMYVGYFDRGKAEAGGWDPNTSKQWAFGTKNAQELESGRNYISDVDLYRRQHPEAIIDTIHTTDAGHCGSDFLGKTAEADLEGGLGLDLEVYGVTLSVMCGYRIGGYGYDNTYAQLMDNDKVGNHNWHVDMRNAWTESNRNTDIPRLNNGGDLYSNAASTRFLTSNSYLSLNNIRLGYNFQKKLIEKIKLSKLELYVQADNLAVLSARKGYNPTVSMTGASNSYQYTPLSTIMGGIKVIF